MDELHDGDGRVAAQTVEQLPVGIVVELMRQLAPQLADGAAHRLQLAEDVGVETGAAREADLLFALRHLEQIFRHAASGAEQIDLEDAHVLARAAMLEHVLERRVGDDPAVPIRLAVDLDRREARRERAARHDMVGADRLRLRVEILQIAGQHLHGADAQAHVARVEQVEIDKLDQRLAKRGGVIDADRFGRALRAEQGRGDARGEEARHAGHHRQRGARLVEQPPRIVVVAEGAARQPARHAVPERTQAARCAARADCRR